MRMSVRSATSRGVLPPFGALGDERLDRRRHDVAHDDPVAGPQEVPGHRLAHDPEADEPDAGQLLGRHLCSFPLGPGLHRLPAR